MCEICDLNFISIFPTKIWHLKRICLSQFLIAVYLNDLLDHFNMSSFIIFYADDISLLTLSVSQIHLGLIHLGLIVAANVNCQGSTIDMTINTMKSCCMRIGPRFDTTVAI